MHAGGYAIDILVEGFPGKSLTHGGLGWSTIVLLRGHGRAVLIDAGPFGMRKLLPQALERRGLVPGDITDLVLSHSHHDHSVNWPLFRHGRIVIGARELAWSLEEPWGESPVPELSMLALKDWPTLTTAEDGEEVLPGITAHLAPGHTPGHLIFVLRGEEHDVIFLQDAVKTRAELVSRRADMTYDPAVSAATCEMIWELWRRRRGTILIPGHDAPMRLENGAIRMLGRPRAVIRATFADDPDLATTFDLSPTDDPRSV